MEACGAEEDGGAGALERGAGVYEAALLVDPAGGAAAPPSAKEVFEGLVNKHCAAGHVNCWWRKDVDACH